MNGTAICVFSRTGSARPQLASKTARRRSLFETVGAWMEPLERRVLLSTTAATVALDPTFGQGGYAQPTDATGGSWAAAGYCFVTPAVDGKFYAIHENPFDSFWQVGFQSFDLLRLNADGSLDPGFGDGGAVRVQHVDEGTLYYPTWSSPPALYTGPDSVIVGSLVVQPDGKVLVAASATPPGSPDPFLLMRFNPDGSPDTGFGQGGTVELPVIDNNWEPPHIALRPDGKIELLDIGAPGNDDGSTTLQLRQFNADGSPDESVGSGGERVTQLDTGFEAAFQAALPALQARLEHDGIWGENWSTNASSWNYFDSLQALPDGTSVASFTTDLGASTNGDGFGGQVEMVHFDAAGNVVMSKVVHAATVNSIPSQRGFDTVQVTAQPDGKLLVLDTADDPVTGGQLTRYDVDGNIDPTFGTHGAVSVADEACKALWVTVDADGTLLVTVGTKDGEQGSPYFDWVSDGVRRLTPDGRADAAFASGQAVFGVSDGLWIGAATGMPDGSVVLTLQCSTWGSTSAPLARILPRGGDAGTFDPHSLDVIRPDPNAAPPASTDPGSTDPSAGDSGSDPGADPGTTDTSAGDSGSDTGSPGTDPSMYYRLSAGGQDGSDQQQGFFADEAAGVLEG